MVDIVVKLADLAVTDGVDASLDVYEMGSTVAFLLYDEEASIGGIVQFMLPYSMSNSRRALEYPCMYADTGIPLLVKSRLRAGARR